MWLVLSVASALSAVGFSALGGLVFQPSEDDEGAQARRGANLAMTVLAVAAAMFCAIFLLLWFADLLFSPLQGFGGEAGAD
jgi:hypothetical protein